MGGGVPVPHNPYYFEQLRYSCEGLFFDEPLLAGTFADANDDKLPDRSFKIQMESEAAGPTGDSQASHPWIYNCGCGAELFGDVAAEATL